MSNRYWRDIAFERPKSGLIDRIIWSTMRIVGALAVGGAIALAFHGIFGKAYGMAMFPFATLMMFMRLRDPQP